jgi:hypothetical protein
MKHLKSYKIFESFSSIEDLLQEAKEICLELNDANIRTECYHTVFNQTVDQKQPVFITVGMERTEYFDDGYGLAGILVWNEIEEVVDRLIEYFESNNWNLSSMMMDGDSLIHPKKWIENLRKKDSYTFSGLKINFTQE